MSSAMPAPWRSKERLPGPGPRGRVRRLRVRPGAPGWPRPPARQGLASPALTAGLRVDEDELPLVVVRPALIGPDRFRVALAGDAKNSTLCPSATLRTERRGWSVLGWTRLSSRPSLPAAPRSWGGLTSLPAAPGSWGGLTNLACRSACRTQRDEIIVRDGVLVFLAKIVPLDQCVDARAADSDSLPDTT